MNDGTNSLSSSAAAVAGCQGAACATCDLPWGGTLPSGKTADVAFNLELIECTDSCDTHQVILKCDAGKLTAKLKSDGTPITNVKTGVFNQCYKKHCDCAQSGVTIVDGGEHDFYRSATVRCTSACTDKRTLKCTSGVLSDKLAPTQRSYVDQYQAKDCQVLPCQNCKLTSGDVLPHGFNGPVFSVREVACGLSCQAQQSTATCTDGQVASPGGLNFQFSNCQTKQACTPCKLPCGINVLPGGSGSCYRDNKPTACGLSCASQRQQYGCSATSQLTDAVGAVLSGDQSAFASISCNDKAACTGCTVPQVGQVADGARVPFFKRSTVACGQSCFTAANQVVMTCSNGTFANKALYPDFTFGTCNSDCTSNQTTGDKDIGRLDGAGGGAPNQVCGLPWADGVVTHQTQITAYSRMSAPAGHKCSEYQSVITCNGYRGLWSGGGTYVYQTCK